MSESIGDRAARRLEDHLVHISAQLVELQVRLRRLEKNSGIEEARGVATSAELAVAVMDAIRETRATLEHAHSVERAAQASLEGKAYDADALRGLIRTELEGKKR